MSAPRLPDGFAVQLDRRVRTVGSGSALLGGSPVRLLRLSPTAQALLDGGATPGRLEVNDAVSAQLARNLLDASVAHPRPSGGPSHRDVTVVIPVRDNTPGVRRLVGSLRDMRVVVVDDGSQIPLTAADFVGCAAQVELVRHPRSRGPAAARNTGLARCGTEFVAFLDSDVLPRRGWLESLLGHFCDPSVALVAPRIAALGGGRDTLLSRYETAQSCLDLGSREAPVTPYGPVSYVPSAAIICRRSALAEVDGFDESLQSGEDVDLCWRLLESGFRLRYEPIAGVSHEHRTELRPWLARRAFYGGSAAALSMRHPDKMAPVIVPAASLPAWLLLAAGSPAAALAAAAAMAVSGRRTVRAMRGTGVTAAEAAALAARGLGASGAQLCAAVCRPYWPLALAAAAMSRRARRATLAAVAVTSVRDWARRSRPVEQHPALGPVGYSAVRRLDDMAYGAGLWTGVVRERTLAPLKPDIRR